MAPKNNATAPVLANISSVPAQLAAPHRAFVSVPCGIAAGSVAAVIDRSVGGIARATA